MPRADAIARDQTLEEDQSPTTRTRWARQLSRAKLLTVEQEKNLAVIIAKGLGRNKRGELIAATPTARAAANEMVRGNIRFAFQVALKSAIQHKMQVDDLMQEANIGLYSAALRFRPERGNKFLTFAVWWIRAFMNRRIMADFSLVKVGTASWQRQSFFRLSQTDGGVMTDTRARSARTQALNPAQRVLRSDLSLATPIGPETSVTFGDALSDSPEDAEASGATGAAIEHRQLLSHAQDKILAALNHLNPRQREVIERRFYTEGGATLDEVGASWGVTRERVRQIEKIAFGKLRELFGNDPHLTEIIAALNIGGPGAVHRAHRTRASNGRREQAHQRAMEKA